MTAASAAVWARHERVFRCPICQGAKQDPVGQDRRCFGETSADGAITICTNDHVDHGTARYSEGAQGWIHYVGDGERTRPPQPAAETGRDPLSPDQAHAIYRDLLALLPLRREHANYLRSRGATDYTVAVAQGYGSLPVGYRAARQVVTALTATYGADVLARAPGIYHNPRGELTMHTAMAGYDAYLVPAHDEQGRITGMQRRAVLDVAATHSKYETLAGGTNQFYTVAGPDWQDRELRVLTVVEGTHKAYVAAALSGRRVFGLPATVLHAPHLAAIRRLAPDVVVVALDADRFRKPAVARAEAAVIRQLLTLPDIEVRRAVWEEADGKGLDDLYATGHRPRLRTVPRVPVLGRRYPEPAAPGPVPAGRPLMEVQAETTAVITEHLGHPRRHAGELLVAAAGPGTGKSTAALTEVERQGRGRVLVATHERAAEIAATYPSIGVVHGRNRDNCEQIAVVQAARRKGYEPALDVCPACPALERCKESGYLSQFKEHGPLVAPVEFLNSAPFLAGGGPLVLDDPQLERALVDERHATASELLQLGSAVGPGPLRELLTTTQRAIDGLQAQADGSFLPPLLGADAWDTLARAAGSADALLTLIDQLEARDGLDFKPGRTGHALTAADFDALPPAILRSFVRVLAAERDAFAAGDEWNSSVALSPAGLTLRTLRQPRKPVLGGRPVLLCDATPQPALVDALARLHGLTRSPDYAPAVALPETVTITQIADRSFGKTALGQKRTAQDGTIRDTGTEQALTALAAARADYRGDREAIICAKGIRDAVITATGLPPERVLTFHAARGMNAVQDADVLFVLGRPQEPTAAALALAHALHPGEEPLLPHQQLARLAYAGYVAPDGQGRAFDVLGFVDARVNAVFEQARTAELLQCLHRARPYRVGAPQANLFAPAGENIARSAQARSRLRIVLLTNQPIPALPVDELVYTQPEQGHPDENERRQAAATARIGAAIARRQEAGEPVGVRAISREAAADNRTVARVLRESEFVGGVGHPKQNEIYLPSTTPPTNCSGQDPAPPDPERWRTVNTYGSVCDRAACVAEATRQDLTTPGRFVCAAHAGEPVRIGGGP